MDMSDDARFSFRVIRAADIDVIGIVETADIVTNRVANFPVYLSIDIDVLDPAFAPGTGTPEVGDLSSRELLKILRSISHLQIVGWDIVEVAPAYDHSEVTTLAAATVLLDLVAMMVSGSSPR